MLLTYIVVASLFVSVGLICARRERFRSTTLVAPSRWAVLSLSAIALVELWLGSTHHDASTIATWRYIAGTSTFCPLVAVLGAKRPQNTAWQFIVASFVMMLPVVQTILLWRGGVLDIGPARRWFLLILIGIGFTNYALTSFWFAIWLAVLGQLFLLTSELPLTMLSSQPWHTPFGCLLLVCAVVCVWFQTRRWKKHHSSDFASSANQPWNRVWADFRNAFGVIWALRVIERVNATGKISNWASELTWFGFQGEEQPASKELAERERTMRTLLRRFVSAEWISRRLVPVSSQHEADSV